MERAIDKHDVDDFTVDLKSTYEGMRMGPSIKKNFRQNIKSKMKLNLGADQILSCRIMSDDENDNIDW